MKIIKRFGKLLLTTTFFFIFLTMDSNLNIGTHVFGLKGYFRNFLADDSFLEQGAEVDPRYPSEVYVDELFLINTSGCRIPNFNPFHPTLKVYLKTQPKVTCNFSSISDVTTSKINILSFYPEKLPLKKYQKLRASSKLLAFYYLNKLQINLTDTDSSLDAMREYVASNINCCFKYVTRVTHWNGKLLHQFDSSYVLSEDCYDITQPVTVMTHECIVVYCSSTDELIYKNVHHLVIKRPNSFSVNFNNKATNEIHSNIQNSTNDHSSNKRDTPHKFEKKKKDRLSVIIFGIDSISRLNFIRKMPKTYKYLMENLEAMEFLGYNKIGDNSFPNLLPMLIGLSIEEFFKHPCMPRKFPNTFDDCPWIWKDFKKKGYTTAYMEDSSSTGTFNQNHSGFLNPPTDYYGRPYYIASEQLTANGFLKSTSFCQGNRYNIKVLQDFSVEFMEASSSDLTFSFLWSSSMTHDFLNSASLVDKPSVAYLESLYETGALNKSVLIFMSDHGMRYGKFRQTDIGALEERLPMFYMTFPTWFKERYPTAFSNLKKNTKSLTANFDIYQTLLDIIHTKYENEQYLKGTAVSATRGISLFKEIPDNRTCEDAGIHPHFCTCHEMEEIGKDDPIVLSGAKYVVDFVNKELESYKACSTYTNVSVLRSEISKWSGKTNLYIFLQLQLDPGSAIIETTIRNDLQFRRRPSEILGEISRIDSYGNQSHCIDHQTLRKYCICNDILGSIKI